MKRIVAIASSRGYVDRMFTSSASAVMSKWIFRMIRTGRVVRVGMAVAFLLAFSGCSSLSGKDKSPPTITVFDLQAWYGRVNCWAENLDTIDSDVKACAKNGVSGYMIELLSWGRYSASADKMAKTEEAYKRLLSACRKNGLWLFVSIANDNAGQGKYGDSGPKLEGQKALLDWGLRMVLANGQKNVIVQPVAETQTSYGKSWNAAAGKALKQAGFATVNNSDGGHPKSKPSWANFNAQHPCDRNIVVNNDLCISDCGTIIRQLMGGYDTKGQPEYSANWVSRQNGHSPVAGFYAFKYLGPTDTELIKAIGKAAK